MDKIRTITSGLDTPTDYGPASVQRILAVPAFSSIGDAAQPAVRISLLPSFHPEAVITLYRVNSQIVLALHTAQTNLWMFQCWELQRARGNLPQGAPRPAMPIAWSETRQIASEGEPIFEAALSLGAAAPKDPRWATLDGIGLLIESQNTAGQITIVDSSKHQVREEGQRLISELHALAERYLVEPQSIRVLEQLYMYFDGKLPVKHLDGPPRTIRIFGSLSVDDTKQLRQVLLRIPTDVPLIMDLEYFEGMGTILHTPFRVFANRPGKTAWIASEAARRHFAAIGVNEAEVFQTRTEALASLADVT